MPNPKVTVRLPDPLLAEWRAACRGDFAGWVRRHLSEDAGDPAPAAADALQAAFDRGWDLGATYDRLVVWFEQGREAALDPAPCRGWAQARPADWAAIQARFLFSPFAARFSVWWDAAAAPPAEPGAPAPVPAGSG